MTIRKKTLFILAILIFLAHKNNFRPIFHPSFGVDHCRNAILDYVSNCGTFDWFVNIYTLVVFASLWLFSKFQSNLKKVHRDLVGSIVGLMIVTDTWLWGYFRFAERIDAVMGMGAFFVGCTVLTALGINQLGCACNKQFHASSDLQN